MREEGKPNYHLLMLYSVVALGVMSWLAIIGVISIVGHSVYFLLN